MVLVISEPSGGERVLPIDEEVITIGRDPACTVRLDSPYVSRLHARIEVRGGAAVLVDLGSRNAALLNGARVQGSARLSEGDVIGVADATIQYRAAAATEGTTRTYVASRPEADVLRVDPKLYEVWLGRNRPRRRLSAQEFQLLRHLYEHRERVCLRRELGDAVWGADNWDINMLHRLVSRLKEKIEPDPDADQPRYVQTVPQIGYRVTP
jgi:DNA-binding response OmpR family regulator